jgi:hypothetical protein
MDDEAVTIVAGVIAHDANTLRAVVPGTGRVRTRGGRRSLRGGGVAGNGVVGTGAGGTSGTAVTRSVSVGTGWDRGAIAGGDDEMGMRDVVETRGDSEFVESFVAAVGAVVGEGTEGEERLDPAMRAERDRRWEELRMSLQSRSQTDLP